MATKIRAWRRYTKGFRPKVGDRVRWSIRGTRGWVQLEGSINQVDDSTRAGDGGFSWVHVKIGLHHVGQWVRTEQLRVERGTLVGNVHAISCDMGVDCTCGANRG